MSDRNNHRKCAKCGKTRADDMTVTYHRFPKPGIMNKISNLTKARAWAKYCWPNKDWSSLDFLWSVHKQNKVLCGRHFHSSQYYDSNRQKLNKFAIPDSPEILELPESVDTREICSYQRQKDTSEEPKAVASTSRLPLSQIDEKACQSNQKQRQKFTLEVTEAVPSTSRMPLSQIDENPCPSNQKQSTPIKESKKDHALQSATIKKNRGLLKVLDVRKITELTSREIKLYNLCKNRLREIMRLRKQLKKRKANVLEKISEDDNVRKLCNSKLSNAFVALLQSQMQNCPKKPKGRRYTLEQKLMSLVIYKKSPACYRLLRRLFALPGQTCLNGLLNKVPLKPGINNHLFDSLKKMAQKQTEDENMCLLLFDEMSIRKHINYSSKLDQIQGFQDHGNHGRSMQIATKALVFMLTGLRKKWKQPVAFYFSHILNADRMTVILKEILTECFKSEVNVVATVCDLSTVNIKVLKSLGATTREPYFSHAGHEIVAILDPPHLLKCTRNLLMKHDVQCMTDLQCGDETVKGIVKWSHIKEFYSLDRNNPNFVYAPVLTDEHIHPNTKQQMRVKLAAQVFSHTVAAGLLAKIAEGALPTEAHATASFVRKFDELFDAVNADSSDLRRGKKYSTNLTAHTSHIALFNDMRKFISTMKYLGSKTNPPSQEGWVHTLNAIERLWKNLRNKHIKSLSTRRLNQDPLENCFGCIRYNCGSNYNPTIEQFVAGVKTAVITNLRHAGNKKNCEDDTAVLENNLSTFLMPDFQQESNTIENPTSATTAEMELESLVADAVEAVELATPEAQACAYVCGFIFKRLRHSECENCRKVFVSENPEAIHVFTSFREYNASQNTLNYINKEVVTCVESVATIVNNYLEINAFRINIKKNIMTALDCIDYNFLNKCEIHLDENKNELKMSCFYILIKRYTTLFNRTIDEEEKKKALERKMLILRNK